MSQQLFPNINITPPRSNEPIRRLKGWTKGELLRAVKLTEEVNVVNQLVSGVRSPEQGLGNPIAPPNVPYYRAMETKEEFDDEIEIRRIADKEGNLVTGDNETVPKMLGTAIRKGDQLIPVRTKDGTLVYKSDAGWHNDGAAKTLLGSGTSPNETYFDYMEEVDEEQGVKLDLVTRVVYDDATGELMLFKRELEFDQSGNLIKISAENKDSITIAVDCP